MKFLYIVLAHSFLGRIVSFSFRIETCKGGPTLSGKRSPAPPHPSPLREKNVPSLISNWAQNTLLYRRLKWVSGVCKFDLLNGFPVMRGKKAVGGPKDRNFFKKSRETNDKCSSNSRSIKIYQFQGNLANAWWRYVWNDTEEFANPTDPKAPFTLRRL